MLPLGGGANLQLPRFKTPANRAPNLLTLYGTGFSRARDGKGGAASVNVSIDGQPARVLYAGRQGILPGLDQILVEVPAGVTAKGARQAAVVVSMNGAIVHRATTMIP